MSDEPMQTEIEVYGDFIRLTSSTWVKWDAIVVIRTRQSGEGTGSEVVVRTGHVGGGSANSYTVWTDHTAQQIIDAITDAATA